jgi:hypothetical protein
VFPHGDTLSVGTGSADKGFSLRAAVGRAARSQRAAGCAETLRREGAPIPMKPLPRWDNGRDVVLAGDAAGVVAPASGEGIYYAMTGGRLAAEAAVAFLRTGDASAPEAGAQALHARAWPVFWVLGMMQHFWYSAATSGASASSASARTATCSSSPSTSYMNKRAGAQEADGPCAHLLQGHGAPAGPGPGSLLYFRLQRPDWALMEVGLLWLSVLLLMVVTGRYSRKASLLLAPYLVWIAFAGALNAATVRLNGPF